MSSANEKIRAGLGYIQNLLAQKEALDRAAIVAFTDLKGTIVEINDMFCQISGYSRDELIGQNHRILNSGYHPHAFFKDLFATVGRGGIWRNEIRNRNKSGAFYWVDTTIAPVRDEYGKIVKYMAIRFDITEKKNIQLARQEAIDNLKVANDELAQFAYRASHDLKSPISRSRELLEYVIQDLNEGETDIAVKNSQKIVTQLRSLEVLVVDILSLARADLHKEEHVELHFEEIILAIQSRIEGDITDSQTKVEYTIDTSNTIYGERGRYDQILYNLISNSVKYRDQAKPTSFVQISITDHNNILSIKVEDNGLGIPEDKHGQVYNLFEIFHPAINRGSGLGLSIVKKHVNALGGSINFESSPAGTVFTIEIPE